MSPGRVLRSLALAAVPTGLAAQAPAPQLDYWVYVTAESSDQVHKVRFDGARAEVVKAIDVGVLPTEIEGPHHRHPTGEICMVMPVDAGALFDGSVRGWCVYPPGSDHRPTVRGGRALVLYMLPDGRIEFTGR